MSVLIERALGVLAAVAILGDLSLPQSEELLAIVTLSLAGVAGIHYLTRRSRERLERAVLQVIRGNGASTRLVLRGLLATVCSARKLDRVLNRLVRIGKVRVGTRVVGRREETTTTEIFSDAGEEP